MIIPPSRPAWPREQAVALLIRHGLQATEIALLGVRGFYRDAMGVPGQNDRGIYDDAIFLVSPNVYASYNANTDPSITRPNVAVLQPGVWLYKKGKHVPPSNPASAYWALRQAAPVTVARDDNEDPGSEPQLETGFFGINIHRGSRTTTSSLGCQTIFPTQYDAFLASVYAEMERSGVRTIPYVLSEETG